MSKKIRLLTTPLLAFLSPGLAIAHEVYVLTPEEIAYGLVTEPASPMSVVLSHSSQFIFWAFVGFLIVSTVFAISISRRLERLCNPWLERIKKYAEPVARITVGLGFLASAYNNAFFGPELPLPLIFGAFAPFAVAIMTIAGLCMLVNTQTRIAGITMLGLFLVAVFQEGMYMLTYTNYLGEMLVLLIGIHTARHAKGAFDGLMHKLAPYSFPLLRVTFGISLLYAAVYAKLIHAHLALQVVDTYHLTTYLHFEPNFLVLGAALVEITIGAFFLLGIEIRHTALFLELFLFLSLLYFGETVWPHLVLIGIPIAFFLHGYDRASLEGAFFKKGRREPVL